MLNLQSRLIDLLQPFEKFIVNQQLNKNKIIEAILQLDTDLIKTLLKDELVKKSFFMDVEGTLVFDKIKFQRFINNKSFLPDSYTAFKNKIGLAVNDDTTDNFIKAKNDVVLAWPYKDCVLEGGQTKEDQKRNEIFWNETLAPENIDRLLDAKTFTNFKNDIKTIANRPLNTTYDNKVLRLADYTDEFIEVDFKKEEILFHDFLETIKKQLEKFGENSNLEDFIPLKFFIDNRNGIANPEAVLKAMGKYLHPFIEKLQFSDNSVLKMVEELSV